MVFLYLFFLRYISSNFIVDIAGGGRKNGGSTDKRKVQNSREETVIGI